MNNQYYNQHSYCTVAGQWYVPSDMLFPFFSSKVLLETENCHTVSVQDSHSCLLLKITQI
jgi:hypothetical protein